MGSATSLVQISSSSYKFHDGSQISQAQLNAVVNSWELISQNDQLEELGRLAFGKMFRNLPETFGLFPNFRDNPEWETSMHYQHHCKVVMKVIGYFVKILQNDSLLQSNGDQMGMRHSLHPLFPKHFEVFGTGFVESFQEILKEKFTEDGKQGWMIVYNVITNMLLTSMTNYNKDFKYVMPSELPPEITKYIPYPHLINSTSDSSSSSSLPVPSQEDNPPSSSSPSTEAGFESNVPSVVSPSTSPFAPLPVSSPRSEMSPPPTSDAPPSIPPPLPSSTSSPRSESQQPQTEQPPSSSSSSSSSSAPASPRSCPFSFPTSTSPRTSPRPSSSLSPPSDPSPSIASPTINSI